MEVNSEFGRIQTTSPCEKIDLIPSTVPLPTTMNPTSTLLRREELTLQIPAICSSTQQVLLNPSWSLKQVELIRQVGISTVKLTCSSFLHTSPVGWWAWLSEQTFAPSSWTKRDAAGTIGTGLSLKYYMYWCTCAQIERNHKWLKEFGTPNVVLSVSIRGD